MPAIINMSCPRCKGETTEYESNKWKCLRCGNKFIYDPYGIDRSEYAPEREFDWAGFIFGTVILIAVLGVFAIIGFGFYDDLRARKEKLEIQKIDAMARLEHEQHVNKSAHK